MQCWAAIPAFDENRGTFPAFAAQVMENRLASKARARYAIKRHSREESLEALAMAGFQVSERKQVSDIEAREFAADRSQMLAELPTAVRETAVLLMENSAAEVARISGRSTSSLYCHIRQLRTAFERAGIGPDYFSSTSVERSYGSTVS